MVSVNVEGDGYSHYAQEKGEEERGKEEHDARDIDGSVRSVTMGWEGAVWISSQGNDHAYVAAFISVNRRAAGPHFEEFAAWLEALVILGSVKMGMETYSVQPSTRSKLEKRS